MKGKLLEFYVGVLMILGILALFFLALQVSGLSLSNNPFTSNAYSLRATFDNVGSLKKRSPVEVGGVQIGSVTNVHLDPVTYKAVVTMKINNKKTRFPDDTTASIVQSGLLGDNLVSLAPGYASKMLPDSGMITTTYSATNLQSLISNFVSGGKK